MTLCVFQQFDIIDKDQAVFLVKKWFIRELPNKIFQDRNNLRPVRGRKRVSPIQAVYVPLKQLTPRQGTKTPWWIPFKLLYETKHTLNNITEEDIKESMGISSKILIEKLEKLLKTIYGDLCAPKLFDIYDTCNAYIYQMI